MTEKIVVSQLNLQTPIDTLENAVNFIYLHGMYYDISDAKLVPKLIAFAEYGVGTVFAETWQHFFQKKVAKNV